MSAQGTVAIAPEPRTVTVLGDGLWDRWGATARADFPARVLFDLQSKDMVTMLTALDRIIVEHNLPDTSGEVAGSMLDVDPAEGAVAIASLIFGAISTLPNR